MIKEEQLLLQMLSNNYWLSLTASGKKECRLSRRRLRRCPECSSSFCCCDRFSISGNSRHWSAHNLFSFEPHAIGREEEEGEGEIDGGEDDDDNDGSGLDTPSATAAPLLPAFFLPFL